MQTQLGAQILTFPSAFTVVTGMAHWEVTNLHFVNIWFFVEIDHIENINAVSSGQNQRSVCFHLLPCTLSHMKRIYIL